MQEDQTYSDNFKVYYDGGCPLCSKEIETYRRASGAENLDWVDASRCEADTLGSDLDRNDALSVMHVRDESGKLISGAAAFAAIWERLPRTRRIGKLLSTRPVLWILEPAYRVFLKLRPLWRKPPACES